MPFFPDTGSGLSFCPLHPHFATFGVFFWFPSEISESV